MNETLKIRGFNGRLAWLKLPQKMHLFVSEIFMNVKFWIYMSWLLFFFQPTETAPEGSGGGGGGDDEYESESDLYYDEEDDYGSGDGPDNNVITHDDTDIAIERNPDQNVARNNYNAPDLSEVTFTKQESSMIHSASP